MRYIVVSIISAICLAIILPVIFGSIGGLVFLVIAAGAVGYLLAMNNQLEARVAELENLNGIDHTTQDLVSNEEIERELEQNIDDEHTKK